MNKVPLSVANAAQPAPISAAALRNGQCWHVPQQCGALTGPFVSALRSSPVLSSLLDGINVASLALMAGVTLQLARETVLDPLAVLIRIVALVLLLRFNTNSAWLVIVGGVLDLADRALSVG